ncbi:MAG: beta-galactosidase trimerization domain-containing protein [Devosia nanyangense]|uniref:Beta-galactosidase trimerization domain-containing protein n=1 Tax=Devosia nanyangense TaxID=1228055 RepID=A0A933L4X2_9HYPH|nr:beta-galactosidase trimerization domain-containing protein [Devosia nanyangense]
MSHWFRQSFRKLHLLYVSPQWALRRGEAFDAVALADAYERAGVDCVQLYCKDHHGVCYYPSSLGLQYPRDILGELLPELKKRGIRLMAYMSMFFDNYATGLHPEWRAVNELGDPQRSGPFFHASVCSPYAEFLLTQLDEVATGYDVDGFWLDIVPLARHLPQEVWMIQPHPVPDYSLHAQKRYREATGHGLPVHPSATEIDGIYEFMTGEVDAFMNKAYATLRKHRPDAVITYNAAGAPGDPLDSADLISIEGHAPHYTRQSFIARWAKGQQKPFEMMTAGGLARTPLGGGWNSLDQKPAAILQLEAAIVVAQAGNPTIGQVPFPDGATDPAQFETFARVFHPIREIEPWLVGAKGVSDVGVVLASKPRSASAHWQRMTASAEAVHEALIAEHIQYDIIRLTEDLSRYRVVVLAEQTALSDTEVEALRSYVKAGGSLIAAGSASLHDERGQPRPDFALADVFGAHHAGTVPADFVYLTLEDATLRSLVTAVPIIVDQPGVAVTLAGAHRLASLIEPEARRTDATTVLWGDAPPDWAQAHPGLIENRFGAGSCRYLAFPIKCDGLPNAWVKRLVGQLVRDAVEEPLLATTASPGVEVTLNRQGDRLVVHFCNHHAGDPNRLSFVDNALAMQGVELRLDFKRAGLAKVSRVYAAPASDIAFAVVGDHVALTVPEFVVHSVVVLE